MATKGLWRLELQAGIYRFAAPFLLLLATAALTVIGYDYIVENLPANMQSFVDLDLSNLDDYRYYIWTQWFGKNLIQFAALVSVVYGATMISGEKSRNTLQFALSKPLSRTELLQVKYITVFFAVALAVILSTLGLFLMILFAGRSVSILWLMENTVLMLVGVALLIGIGGYFSVLMESSLKAAGATALVVFLLSVPGFIPGWQQFSLFYHMQGASLMAKGHFPILAVVVMLLTTVGVCYLAKGRFNKLDL